jgi:hypothetical protein
MQMMVDSRNSGYNVRQILYNRNYAETIRDYKIQGHKIVRRVAHEVALHQYKVGNDFGYGNCHYWPHYSFRPSLIDVAAILTVGNYDTPNQFFEMDYAHRWMQMGFVSGFYNHITNRHIGRLTSERNDQTQPNAYELNHESQFTAPVDAVPLASATVPAVSAAVVVPPTPPPIKKRYYSTIPFDDGLGAQFQRFVWTCIYAEVCEEATFIYRSPEKMAHNYEDDPKYIEKLEDLMNMKPHYLNYKEALLDKTIGHILTPDFYDIFNYVERNIDTCMKSQSMARIKEYYWRNKDRVSERRRLFHSSGDGDGYTHHLAAHIRRPNCDDTRPNGGEEYTNEYYINSLLLIREKYMNDGENDKKKNRIQFHIYSQGSDDKFADFLNHEILGPDIRLHINEDNQDTYLGMTVADILVTSASSYSYSAAFFCEGDIYYTDFWHKPCSWWNKLPKTAG